MAGAVAMVSVLVVVGIEMFFALRGAGHVHGSEYDQLVLDHENPVAVAIGNGHMSSKLGRRRMSRSSRQSNGSISLAGPRQLPDSRGMDAIPGKDDSDSDLDIDELDPIAPSAAEDTELPRHVRPPAPSGHLDVDGHRHSQDGSTMEEAATRRKLLLQILLLEASILFHSIFIGLTLSLTTTGFTPFLIAISIHQTFEGLALGARIAAIPFLPRSPQPWLMALAYGATTPIGQAIGLAVQGTYDPMAEGGLIVMGLSNAVGSGLLLFAGLVELLAEDFLSERSLSEMKGRPRTEACVSVVAGAALMALTGAWA
jgi:solute carrier family 39 (zinc transporter), member 1/2/3